MSTRELLRIEQLPVYQNKMFDTAESARACPRGDVVLAQDDASGLVANAAFDASLLQYDDSYQNEQGHSGVFRAHLDEVMAVLARHFRAARILEIGCGKGDFLARLRSEGYEARGVDPAYEGDSPHIVKAAFAPGLGLTGDAVVMRHVLEHIPDPCAFLDVARRANGGTGLVYIEVPCLDWILRRQVWFDVFYEHVNYFRIEDFRRLFARVIDAGHVFGGQYIYVVADLASLRDPASPALPPPLALAPPADFFGSIERCLALLRSDRQRVIWGAAAKGVTFAHHLALRGEALDFAIDINPAKQGRFLAVSGLPVLAPATALARLQPGANIVVMNSNYLDEIERSAGPAFHYVALDQT
jgi:SAM-dependent methyltransferase